MPDPVPGITVLGRPMHTAPAHRNNAHTAPIHTASSYCIHCFLTMMPSEDSPLDFGLNLTSLSLLLTDTEPTF